MKIGLEVHVQLPTRSKLFCSCATSAEEPNTAICPTCLGLPGSRPVLNRRALELGLTIARMMECEVPDATWFTRKTYFYPDLPRHFQITQFDSPIGERGQFILDGKKIRIRRVHLEDDPGRVRRVGKTGEEVSLIDYNRSGIPLVEIVTEPDITSPSEARRFVTELLKELRHVVGVQADGESSVRADCNISVAEERVEVKNVQGLRNIERALKYEAVRQVKLLKAKRPVLRETRRFEEGRGVTLPARKKEFEEDYGYIGEPDLGVFHIRAMADALEIREGPMETMVRLVDKHGVQETVARQIVSTSMSLASLFERLAVDVGSDAAITWVTGPITASWSKLEPRLDEVENEVVAAIISTTSGKMSDVEGRMRIEALAEGRDLETIQAPEGDIIDMVESFLDDNPELVKDFQDNEKAANRAIGQIMQATKGSYSSRDVVAAVMSALRKRI